MSFILVVGFVLLGFLLYRRLSSRISALEKMLGHVHEQKKEPQIQAQPQAQPIHASVAVPLQPAAAYQPSVAGEHDLFEKFFTWVKEDWLLKLGALLLLLSFGWLASYAFINGWIGPAGRITLGLFLGTLIMAGGFWRMRTHRAQGAVFLVLGSTAVLLTVYAARSLYDFFTPGTALGLMFMTSTFVAFASVYFNRRQLGIASVVLAGIAPLLTSSPTSDYIALFNYLAVVTVGAVILASLKAHREVIFVALMVVGAYSLMAFADASSAEKSLLLIYAYGFAALLYVSNTLTLLAAKGKDSVPDLLIAAGNALLLAAWVYVVAPEHLQSLIYAGIAVLFVGGAFVISSATRRYESFYVYASIGVAYIAIATASELSGAVLTIAFIIEAGMVTLLAFILTRNIHVAHTTLLIYAGPVLLSLQSIVSRSWGDHRVLSADFFVLLIMSTTLFLLGGALYHAGRATKDEDVILVNTGLFIGGSIYAYILLWLTAHEVFYDDRAVIFPLITYTLIGIATYLSGATRHAPALRYYGGILLAFVVGRLLIIDVWNMELPWRIITFFAIGALLMSTAFLGKIKKHTSV